MKVFLICISILLLYSCGEPVQPINYGKDECSGCKMTLMDEKFGAEIITTKGKVYKFDDLICMVQFLNAGEVEENNIEKKLVIDYQKKNNFLDVETAAFYLNDELHSPMGGNTAAFQNEEAAIAFKKDKTGELLKWDEVRNNSN